MPGYQAARITIGKSKIGNDSATEIRRSLHWVPIRERIGFQITTHIYKCQNNQAPMCLQKLITERKVKHSGLHSSKTKFLLEVPSTKRHVSAERLFSVYGPKRCNIYQILSKKAKQLTHSKEN